MKIWNVFFLLAFVTLDQLYGQNLGHVDSTEISYSKKNERMFRRSLRGRYLHLGFGVTSHKLQDFAVSPLYYKGPLLNAGINYEVQGKDLAWGVFIGGAFGFIYSEQSSTPTMIINPQIQTYYMRKIKMLTGEKIRSYLGAYIMSGGHFRINNGFYNTSASFYDYVTSYGIAGKINSGFSIKEKVFKWNHQGDYKSRFVSIDYQLFIPLIHTYLRPSYAVVANFPSTETNYTPKMKTVSWGTVARLSSQLNFTYYLKNNNAFQFSYKWDAYNINPGFNKEGVSSNTYMVSLMFRLNKKTLE